jgi:hypothetical protein
MSIGGDSSSRYLRAMQIALMAWFSAAGPVASTAGGNPPGASRTTLQMAPATVLGLEVADTLSDALPEAARSVTDAPDMVPSASPVERLAYGAADRRTDGWRADGGRPPRTTTPLLGRLRLGRDPADFLITSSRDMSIPGGSGHSESAGRCFRRWSSWWER